MIFIIYGRVVITWYKKLVVLSKYSSIFYSKWPSVTISRHTIVVGYYCIPTDVCPFALCSRITPLTVFIRSRWNLVDSYTRRWYSTHCFLVTVHQILIALLSFLMIFQTWLCFRITPPTIFIWLGWNLVDINYEVIQCVLFGGYSTPNFDRVIAL